MELTEEPTERFYGTDFGLRDPFGDPSASAQRKECSRISTRPGSPPRTPSPLLYRLLGSTNCCHRDALLSRYTPYWLVPRTRYSPSPGDP